MPLSQPKPGEDAAPAPVAPAPVAAQPLPEAAIPPAPALKEVEPAPAKAN